jgi:hypothetical protein
MMVPPDIQAMAAMAVPAIGVIVWLIRLEGRINVTEALQKKMSEDVAYIRARIDRVLNGRCK